MQVGDRHDSSGQETSSGSGLVNGPDDLEMHRQVSSRNQPPLQEIPEMLPGSRVNTFRARFAAPVPLSEMPYLNDWDPNPDLSTFEAAFLEIAPDIPVGKMDAFLAKIQTQLGSNAPRWTSFKGLLASFNIPEVCVPFKCLA